MSPLKSGNFSLFFFLKGLESVEDGFRSWKILEIGGEVLEFYVKCISKIHLAFHM